MEFLSKVASVTPSIVIRWFKPTDGFTKPPSVTDWDDWEEVSSAGEIAAQIATDAADNARVALAMCEDEVAAECAAGEAAIAAITAEAMAKIDAINEIIVFRRQVAEACAAEVAALEIKAMSAVIDAENVSIDEALIPHTDEVV